MDGQYIVVSSITYAYKGKNILERKAIRCSIEKAPKNLSDCGCHYALRIMNAPLDKALLILRAANVKVINSGGAGNGVS